MDNKISKDLDIGIKHTEEIKSKIYTIRGLQVMIDRDLAELYEVTTSNLNKAVQRNIERFPIDFMFKITKQEFNTLNLKFQNGISSWGGIRKLPNVFTETGVATLSGVLKSNRAIEVHIKIMRAFIEMRHFIASNAQLFQRLDRVEIKQLEHDKKFEQVFNALESKDNIPKQGIFFNGQVFDAYKFVSDIIRKADKSITIIDNYIDDTVLNMLTKRKKEVKVIIFTEKISEQLKLDIEKYNSQYPLVEIKIFKKSHDRFIIIDNSEVYHFGASLKDLGRKWFGFSKFEKDSLKILNKLNEL